MDSTTNDPPPELNLLEQIGTWLDAFPAVPPWVQWLLAALTISTAVGGPIVFLFWRRWGANWWAARSRDSALRRGKKIGHNVLRAHMLCRNRPAMLIRLVVFLAWCLAISTLLTLAWINMTNLNIAAKGGLPPSDNLVAARFVFAQVLWAIAFIAGLVLFVWFNLVLAPLFNIDRYTLKSRERIEHTLTKSGASQEIASNVLKTFDDLVDEIQKREIR